MNPPLPFPFCAPIPGIGFWIPGFLDGMGVAGCARRRGRGRRRGCGEVGEGVWFGLDGAGGWRVGSARSLPVGGRTLRRSETARQPQTIIALPARRVAFSRPSLTVAGRAF